MSGGDLGEGFYFTFDNYATTYNWSLDACGYHDDTAYNGAGNADGVTMLIDYIDDVSVCYPELLNNYNYNFWWWRMSSWNS